jgi:hypothetical protein
MLPPDGRNWQLIYPNWQTLAEVVGRITLGLTVSQINFHPLAFTLLCQPWLGSLGNYLDIYGQVQLTIICL